MPETPEEPMTSERPKRRRKKRWASAAAREAHANQRRDLVRKQAERWEADMKRARELLSGADKRQRTSDENRLGNMMVKGLRPRLTAVMNSFGLSLPVLFKAAIGPGGSLTDFSSVTVNYNQEVHIGRRTESGELVGPDLDTVARVAIEIRGAFYHAVGHNIFSVPLPELIELAIDNGTSPSTIEALFDKGLRPRYSEDQDVAERVSWEADSSAHYAWNVLEDHRMEARLVEYSPRLASYLTVTMLTLFAGRDRAWPLLAGRSYLPKWFLDDGRAMWDVPGLGRVPSTEFERVTNKYSTSTSPIEMLRCVREMQMLLRDSNMQSDMTFDEHYRWNSGRLKNDQAASDEFARRIQDSAAAGGVGGGAEGKPEEGENEVDGSGSGKTPGGSGVGDNSNVEPKDSGYESVDEEETADRLAAEAKAREARDDLVRDMAQNDRMVGDDISAVQEAFNLDTGRMATITAMVNSTPADLVLANAIADGVEKSFRIATEDIAPHWAEQQRRGILSPQRYISRQPGDMEIFRNYMDTGEPGAELAVSLYLDISGSMNAWGNRLGVVAWAVKEACRRLSIDCDVNLFSDSDGLSLYDVADLPEYLPRCPIAGGTNPSKAFNAGLTIPSDAKHHLVLVMTDGGWSGEARMMSRYAHPNMHKVVLLFGSHNQAGPFNGAMVPDPDRAAALGADEAWASNDLLDIPRIVESSIIGFV